MNRPLAVPDRQSIHASNVIAAVLSAIIPGLGQIYKGQFESGFLWMPLAVWIGVLLRLATAGLGLIIPALCRVASVVDAYYEIDRCRRRHHHLAEPTRRSRYLP